ncbi:hypothetical protein BDW22DRAFT_943762 [Trametopsis cervina]|nr:hypothetical protein BDW22DRAFT_943762 [Trametopsis cervina]
MVGCARIRFVATVVLYSGMHWTPRRGITVDDEPPSKYTIYAIRSFTSTLSHPIPIHRDDTTLGCPSAPPLRPSFFGLQARRQHTQPLTNPPSHTTTQRRISRTVRIRFRIAPRTSLTLIVPAQCCMISPRPSPRRRNSTLRSLTYDKTARWVRMEG